MILIDANVLPELTRPVLELRVAAWLEVNEPALALPAIALAELRYGIARLPDNRRQSGLVRFQQAMCAQFCGRTFSFDERAAERYGGMAAGAERVGRPLNVRDRQIPAIAPMHGRRVATRNVSNFGAAGVAIANPWE